MRAGRIPAERFYTRLRSWWVAEAEAAQLLANQGGEGTGRRQVGRCCDRCVGAFAQEAGVGYSGAYSKAAADGVGSTGGAGSRHVGADTKAGSADDGVTAPAVEAEKLQGAHAHTAALATIG